MTADDLPQQILYAPIRPWLKRGVFTAGQLNEEAASRGLVTGSGQPLRFMPPTSDGMGYEVRAFETGQVETRLDNWHDLFAAWIWMAFPKAKAAMNLRHWQAMAEEQGKRGLVRDALTQLDECGVVVLCTEVSLWDGIRAHRWRQVFVERRADVIRHLRFLVVGHGSLDALRVPFVGLCGKALCFHVPTLPDAIEDQVALADALLADFLLREPGFIPRRLQPLPLLGIPGATPDNEAAEYYEDERQFRPARPVQSAPEVRQAIAVSLAESRKVRAP